MEAEIHLGLEGDTVLCPSGRSELARLRTGIRKLPGGRVKHTEPGFAQLYCRACGEGAVKGHGYTGQSLRLEHAIGPRILVRSGNWTGWRALGGE